MKTSRFFFFLTSPPPQKKVVRQAKWQAGKVADRQASRQMKQKMKFLQTQALLAR